jgi:DNA topoisomerase-1
VIELVACSAIRPGSEDYRRLHGTRGAATLLKSNFSIYGQAINLKFRSKGGKIVTKEFAAARLARVIALPRPPVRQGLMLLAWYSAGHNFSA